MSENPFDVLYERLRAAIRDEIVARVQPTELYTPDELAKKLKIPVSWIYEQSRQGTLPTHRLGRYIRFDLQEVLRSRTYQEKVDTPS